MTKAETRLWKRLKLLRNAGYHFRRQAPFRAYFLDFVCFRRKLVVELDGAHHGDDDQAEHDGVRDRILERSGFQVMRFWNSELDVDIEGVVDRIIQALEARFPTRPAHRAGLPSPEGEGRVSYRLP